MPLESTMICLDNSDWMRNGDYQPSRIESQKDAAGLLCNDRFSGNPENTVGVLTTAGQGVDMLVSPTEEAGKVLASFSKVKLGGKPDLITAVQIAQLALKHRKNKNGGQRIIIFVGSPVVETVEALQRLGKQLKKNNVAIDIISMGEVTENAEKLQELVNATNTNDNSHLLTVPAGVSPANALLSSSIMHSTSGLAPGSATGGGADFDFGVDPDMDPELAMVLRMSAEEARVQEEARMKALQEETGAQPAPSGTAAQAVPDEEEDEETLMQRALEMSMKDFNESVTAPAAGDMEVEDEEEELRRALALSTQPMESSTAAAPAAASDFNDPEFVSALLSSADPNDPMVQAALAQLRSAGGQSDATDKQNESNDRKRKQDDA